MKSQKGISYVSLYCDECGELIGFGDRVLGRVLCAGCMSFLRRKVVGSGKITLPSKGSTVGTLIETHSLAEAG